MGADNLVDQSRFIRFVSAERYYSIITLVVNRKCIDVLRNTILNEMLREAYIWTESYRCRRRMKPYEN